MSRTLLIAQREFLENMRTRGFWIGILMLPLVLALVALVPLAVQSLSKPKHYTVVDHSGWLLPVIRQEINADDLADLLTEVKAGQQDVPKTFAGIKPVLNALNSTQVHALSFRILATLQFSAKHDDVVLPEPVLTYIDQNGVRLAHWWQQLPAQQKSSYASRISTNKYLYEPPQGRDIQALNLAVKKGELAGYFVIGKHPIDGSDGSRFVSNNLTDQSLASWFSGYVNRHIRSERLRQKEITPTVAAWVNEPISFEGVQIADNGQEKTVNTNDVVRQWTPIAFVYLLWISILINTQLLLTNTIEEKSNRLIEVLLSSVSPMVLMAGKILGIAATGLAMILSWSLMAGAFLLFIPNVQAIKLPVDLASIATDPVFLGSFAVYFILGYLFYAALLVGIGSTCNSLKEAQNLMLPMQLVQMVPIFVMIPIGRDPNGTLAQVLSYIPPLTPFVMMNRAAAPPSWIEYAITTLLLIASIAAALWFAAKIFRIGVLLTGKPPGLLEIFRWLRAPASNPV